MNLNDISNTAVFKRENRLKIDERAILSLYRVLYVIFQLQLSVPELVLVQADAFQPRKSDFLHNQPRMRKL